MKKFLYYNINILTTKMYLIIIEGTDNIGKDTIINKLCELFDNVTLIHCGSPKIKVFQSKYQDDLFKKYAEDIIDGKYDSTDCIIMNRSHIGEYVYGQLYRNRKASDIREMISYIDDIFLSKPELTVKYIQLLSSSIELRKKYDDNKSLSNMDDSLMKKENELFLEAYSNSELDKQLIYVNDEDGFLPKEVIFNEVIEFLNT